MKYLGVLLQGDLKWSTYIVEIFREAKNTSILFTALYIKSHIMSDTRSIALFFSQNLATVEQYAAPTKQKMSTKLCFCTLSGLTNDYYSEVNWR